MESKRDKKKQAYKEKQRLASLKKEQADRLKKLSIILNKDKDQRTEDENKFLHDNNSFISIAESRLLKQNSLRLRTEEIEDDFDILNDKINRLIKLINESKHIIVYTGAGISTSTGIIPDYRGPNGVWTTLNKKGSILKTQDLALAEPTFTHMALARLIKKNIVKHILSQNVDGLHLRSGVPVNKLSEIHGNMFVEICLNCNKVYYRDFDVTENTRLRYHKTGRYCLDCIKLDDKNFDYELIDTIVHFGEKGYLKYPLNWEGVVESLKETDLIICLGSSLKVLKNYPCLWPKKVNIVVVNLQWTPKDKQALIKINCKCDKLMELIMNRLEIDVDKYDKDKDQLKKKFIKLNDNEQSSCRRYQLFTKDNSIKIESTDVNDERLSSNLLGSASLTPAWFAKGLKGFKK